MNVKFWHDILKCIRFRKDWVFEVQTRKAIHEQILPFFDRFRFLSKKKYSIKNLKKFVND